ncbi:MAG: hypothetical protein RTU63_15135 [Candidatus Thorarchaeota archaeon]
MVKHDSRGKRAAEPEPESHIHAGAVTRKSYVLAKGGSNRYKVQNPSTYMRVIRDGDDGREFIISGGSEDTYAQACRANWYFESVHRESKWYIKDERGNDVSDKPLQSVDGIFILIPESS